MLITFLTVLPTFSFIAGPSSGRSFLPHPSTQKNGTPPSFQVNGSWDIYNPRKQISAHTTHMVGSNVLIKRMKHESSLTVSSVLWLRTFGFGGTVGLVKIVLSLIFLETSTVWTIVTKRLYQAMNIYWLFFES